MTIRPSTHPTKRRPSRTIILLLILLLAALLRFYRLDAQSFWNDEGNSARLAERSVALILKGAAGDIHPPGYYLALHAWRAVLGESEFALRSLSALCGLSIVVLVYALGRALFDAPVGLVAAFLAAVNPFQVYYSQEARMYALLALEAVAATGLLVAGLRGRRGALGGYALVAAAGLYTHYAFPFVLLAHNLLVLLWLAGEARWHLGLVRETPVSLLARWLVVQALVLLLYLPWLPTAWRQVTGWPVPRETPALLSALVEVLRLLTLGRTIPTSAAMGGLAAFAFLILLSALPEPEAADGAAPSPLPPAEGEMLTLAQVEATERAMALARRRYTLRWAVPLLLILVPVGLILGLGLYREAYQKFLLVASPFVGLLAGRGLVGGWRLASGAWVLREGGPTMAAWRAPLLLLVAFLLFDTGRSLHNLYFNPAYARADYRAIARQIEAQARPGDAILLNAPNQWEVFTYYHRQGAPVYPLPRNRPLIPERTEAELEAILQQHRRLFVLYWGDVEADPERFIESWLEAHTYKAGERWVGDVRLAVYAVPLAVANTPTTPLKARFGEAIHLEGYTLLNNPLPPGDILQLALFWRTSAPLDERYKVFVHLYDANGRIVAQTDSEPGDGLMPTTTWEVGQSIVDRYGVLLPQELPPGEYRLVIGLYRLTAPEQRLPVWQGEKRVGDALELNRVTVHRLDARE